MTIKKLLLQEIDSSPDSLLQETLDFLRFLKDKQKSDQKDTQHPQVTPTDSSQPDRPASGRSILRHAGTWEGEDFKECLELVYATRGKANFECDYNSKLGSAE